MNNILAIAFVTPMGHEQDLDALTDAGEVDAMPGGTAAISVSDSETSSLSKRPESSPCVTVTIGIVVAEDSMSIFNVLLQ